MSRPRASRDPAPGRGGRCLTLLLRAYPAAFRREYAAPMRQLVRDQRRALGAAGPLAVARFWAAVAWDVARTAPREHRDARARRSPAPAGASESRLRPLLGWGLLLAAAANVVYGTASTTQSMGALAIPLTAASAALGATLAVRARRAHPLEARMPIAALNVLVALVLGFGAVQELVVLGVRAGQTEPFVVGVIGTVVNLMLVLSALAIWRHWPTARRLTIAAAALCIAYHVYAALPPQRHVGLVALLVATGYGLFLLARTFRGAGGPPLSAAADQPR